MLYNIWYFEIKVNDAPQAIEIITINIVDSPYIGYRVKSPRGILLLSDFFLSRGFQKSIIQYILISWIKKY